ncbi:MAG: hypothetical protein J6332_03310 [Abditibacteriota bacterium]|nr:hypothetical protein [Abditibacteriota bacterium]
MKKIYDLSSASRRWTVSGWIPNLWRLDKTMEVGARPQCEVSPLEAKVPGSLQYTLRETGLIPDWNYGMNGRDCEWVENRHWIYSTVLPEEARTPGKTAYLLCDGIDGFGELFVNGAFVTEFKNSHIDYSIDITKYLKKDGENRLDIVFTDQPRNLGQFGSTSLFTEMKTRFNYNWDWATRMVQIGISRPISLEVTDGNKLAAFDITTDADPETGKGILHITGTACGPKASAVKTTLTDKEGKTIYEKTLTRDKFNSFGFGEDDLDVELWQANLFGNQPLYNLTAEFILDGEVIDSVKKRVGFRHVEWEPCEGAPDEFYPWICKINGKRVYLQGVNSVPFLTNYADVTREYYDKRLSLYKDLGFTILRVWGGATLESEDFYDLCDEYGLLVWQEFPLSSSGYENYPPEDRPTIDTLVKIAKSYIKRRKHHASLIIWCGGNELQTNENIPVDDKHPMISALAETVQAEDPSRRFLFTSPSGPVFSADAVNFGKNMHRHVHGPWKVQGQLDDEWLSYWENDDAMFRSECGAPGASSAALIRKYAGDVDPMPVDASNILWRRHTDWWTENAAFEADKGRQPETLEEYVEWSQERQTKIITTIFNHTKGRFPRCGGTILWMGHDCFPCAANTSVVDFEGNPKPVALALKPILHDNSNIK